MSATDAKKMRALSSRIWAQEKSPHKLQVLMNILEYLPIIAAFAENGIGRWETIRSIGDIRDYVVGKPFRQAGQVLLEPQEGSIPESVAYLFAADLIGNITSLPSQQNGIHGLRFNSAELTNVGKAMLPAIGSMIETLKDFGPSELDWLLFGPGVPFNGLCNIDSRAKRVRCLSLMKEADRPIRQYELEYRDICTNTLQCLENFGLAEVTRKQLSEGERRQIPILARKTNGFASAGVSLEGSRKVVWNIVKHKGLHQNIGIQNIIKSALQTSQHSLAEVEQAVRELIHDGILRITKSALVTSEVTWRLTEKGVISAKLSGVLEMCTDGQTSDDFFWHPLADQCGESMSIGLLPIGSRLVRKMGSVGISTVSDLKKFNRFSLQKTLNVSESIVAGIFNAIDTPTKA